MTLSIAARCPETEHLGIAIASSSPAVAARCAWVRAQTGAVCTQNITDPRLGPRLLELILSGFPAQAAIDAVVATTEDIDYRQLTIVDRTGTTGSYAGKLILGTNGVATGDGVVAAGNLLSNPELPAAMIAGFGTDASVPLGDRLLAGLKAGLDAGGEEGPVHSAGLLIADFVSWPSTDLRVDWSESPVEELSAIWKIWQPQIDDYLIRALKPEMAPGFGVPGED